MPELPEVETIRNCLLPQVRGRCFTGVTLLWPGLVRQPSPEEFCNRLSGQQIEDIQRRGKYLIFRLSQGDRLVLHLKMTGVLLLQPSSAPAQPHTRAVFHLGKEANIHFWDQRKFGAAWLVGDELTVVGNLGPEPLDERFTPEVLGKILSRHNMPLKALLLEQNIIAGIGNMYADEALFAARISPLKSGHDLTEEETKRLHQAIREVLSAAIQHSGASVDTYKQPDGELGTAHLFFQVAHRRGERCRNCHAAIQRTTVRGRGTYFCPVCQR